jgi:hypothetical protein
MPRHCSHPGCPEWCCLIVTGNVVPVLAPAEVDEVRSHTVIVGWPTIHRLAMEGAVVFGEHRVALVAADDLFRYDFAHVPAGLFQEIIAALERAHEAHSTELVAKLRAVTVKPTPSPDTKER